MEAKKFGSRSGAFRFGVAGTKLPKFLSKITVRGLPLASVYLQQGLGLVKRMRLVGCELPFGKRCKLLNRQAAGADQAPRGALRHLPVIWD